MDTNKKQVISVTTEINVPIEYAWKCWTTPDDILNWNNASDDWHTPRAENDLRQGGRFKYRMEAKDGSMGFDFEGTYQKVVNLKQISYSMDDERKVEVLFSSFGGQTSIQENFDAETTHSIKLQKNGWQSILDNFKKYCEHKHQKT
ncbi:SRPBCC family protein [Sunxiuqinia sp. A32]|uniref:SRPBCC family protein n=1 Tax=Sunxiuqinia sp. A32 TaxID=3461496 RepID=UPI0040457074